MDQTRRLATGLGVGALALATLSKAEAAPFSTFAYAATGAPTNRTTPNRLSDIINVKDYGAKGDGITNDGAAIQAAFDAAYGPASSPNSTGNNKANKMVFFPAGLYIVNQQLFLNLVQGACLIGAGQHATRLLYTGPASNLPSGDVTSLLTCRSMDYSHIEGITFDVTGSNATVAVQLMNFAALPADGTGNMWFDCGFVGGFDGFLCTLDGSGGTGSEEFFIGCMFDTCTSGALVSSGNALDYTFLGCRFQNCVRGIFCNNGSINLIKGCSFNNPGFASFNGTTSGTTLTVNSGLSGTIVAGQLLMGIDDNQNYITGPLGGNTWGLSTPSNKSARAMTTGAFDILVKQNQCPAIIGCNSTSTHFFTGGPTWVAGCRHVPANPGYLWTGGIDDLHGLFEGCVGGSNSGFYGVVGNLLYLRGNTFSNAGYLTNFAGTVVENI